MRTLGSASRRILLMPFVARDAFQAFLGLVDVLLDPLHFGGGQTTLEAIAAGTPVVTLPSAYRRGRLSLAYLSQAGVPDTVVRSIDEYVALALALGRDTGRRRDLGKRVRAGAGRVFGHRAAAEELEDILMRAVRQTPSR
jgi:predicted O-linked N-acetylglucosamine transferase (SPINDLY family)